eukprot:CCRYP_018924-RA/>CCRYP_018924-RA protein AED:0.15 eAED:0.15 QI:0/-1/0/1/-1/1/1/0/1314
MDLAIPGLPKEAIKGHVVPGMRGHSLVSLVQLCNAGCSLRMNRDKLIISYLGKEVLQGTKCPHTGLWLLPLSQQHLQHQFSPPSPQSPMMANVHHTSSRAEMIQYLHQACFSPTITSWCKAIDNDQFMSFPGLSSAAVKKYLPPSTATAKGHMARNQKNLRSTTKARNKLNQTPTTIKQVGNTPIDPDLNPPEEPTAPCHLFIGATIGNLFENTVYTDLTGQFPAQSYKGNKYVFVAYAYGPNAILARAMPSRTDKAMVEAYQYIYHYLESKGFKPQLNISDNECSKTVQHFILAQNAKIQLVEPHNHRANAAERAIQTFKNHFIAGLSSVDPEFPIQLWDELLEQAQDTLNLLRTSRLNARLSAYATLEGPFNFDRTPLAPPGTKALVYLDPKNRTSWGVHAEDAWYLGPAKQHYRCYRFFMPHTRSYRIAQAAIFYPKHCKMPKVDAADTVRLAAQDLIYTLQNPTPQAPINLTPRHNDALRKLAKIFHTSVPTSEGEQASPRVTTPPATSHEATAPRVLRLTKLTHRKTTRRNQPMPTIKEKTKHTLKTERQVDARTARRLARDKAKQAEDQMFEEEARQNHMARKAPVKITPVTTTADNSRPHREDTHYVTDTESSDDEEEDGEMYCTIAHPKPPNRAHFQTLRHMGFHPTALYHTIGNHIANQAMAFIPAKLTQANAQLNVDIPLEAVANAGVVHPETGETLTKYEQLLKVPALQLIWSKAMCKELGRLAQGFDGDAGTDTIHFMSIEDIKKIPKDRTVTYARIVVDYRPQKTDPNRVRITVGGNLLKDDYPGELTTRTADLTTSKILWNSTLSTEGARYMTADVKNFYLCTPMERYQYMKMKASLIPDEFIQAYNLQEKIYKGFVWLEIRRTMYGLPEAGILSNQLLRKRLATKGYFELPHTPGLWKHVCRPVWFTLVVDDFGVKYIGREHAEHLMAALKNDYEVEEDWTGSLYCGIKLHWNYDKGYLDTTMENYVRKNLLKYNHEKPRKPQDCPYEPHPKKYGTAAQLTDPPDDSAPLNEQDVKWVQRVVGSFLYYARAIDATILMALNAIANEQKAPTQRTKERVLQFLDYMATHPNAVVRFYKSDMILQGHSDASYLSAPEARSRAAGYWFLGSLPQNGQPIKLNGAILVLCTLLKFVAASAAEAELGALFLNAKEARVMRLTLHELGHPQPPTPIHIDNSTTVGIVTNTIKRQKSRSMEMRYFWLLDQAVQKQFAFSHHPGEEILADYPSKAHSAPHHRLMRPFFTHQHNSPLFLLRAKLPSARRGCVEKPGSTYLHSLRRQVAMPTNRYTMPTHIRPVVAAAG